IDAGPHDEVGMIARRGGAPAPGGGAAPPGAVLAPPPGEGPPGPGGDQRQGPAVGHALKDRFLATPAFTAAYEEAYRELYQRFYAGGGAMRVLDELAATVPVSDTLDAASIAADLDTLRQTVAARTEALAADPVIT